MTTQKGQNRKKFSQGSQGSKLGNLHIFLEIQQRVSGPGEKSAGGTYLSMRIHPKICCIFPLKVATTLLSGSRKSTIGAQLSHSEGHCQGCMLALQALMYIEGNDQTRRPIWNYATGTLASWKGCKLDCVIQLNCRKVHTHVSYKTTRTWENFNNQGSKMILLSDEL